MFRTQGSRRSRKRETRRRKLGLNGKPLVDHSSSSSPEPQKETSKPRHNQQKKLDLEASRTASIVIDCLLAADKAFSSSMAIVCSRSKSLRIMCEVTEVLGNGFVWFAFAIYNVVYPKPGLYEQALNFLYGLILDIVLCATLKQIVQRQRPTSQVGEATMIGPDQYSFPSGHASRIVFIATFLCKEFYFRSLYRLMIYLTTLWTILSRLWLGRHYLSDITAGSLLGACVYFFVASTWFTALQIQNISHFFKQLLSFVNFFV